MELTPNVRPSRVRKNFGRFSGLKVHKGASTHYGGSGARRKLLHSGDNANAAIGPSLNTFRCEDLSAFFTEQLGQSRYPIDFLGHEVSGAEVAYVERNSGLADSQSR